MESSMYTHSTLTPLLLWLLGGLQCRPTPRVPFGPFAAILLLVFEAMYFKLEVARFPSQS